MACSRETFTTTWHPYAAREGRRRYSSNLFVNLGLEDAGLWAPRRRPLYPRERPVTHCTGRWVALGGQSGRKISPAPGFDSRTVHHVASRYTDWAISAFLTHAEWQIIMLWQQHEIHFTSLHFTLYFNSLLSPFLSLGNTCVQLRGTNTSDSSAS
jgi:hypothetical protein